MPVTGHGPASRTVTRSTRPSSRKSWVMPSFLARIAAIRSPGESDLDVDAGGEVVEALEGVDRLRRRLVDVDQPLVGADLEVLARVLVLERRPDHAVDVLLRRQRDRPGHGGAGALGRFDDLPRRAIDRVVVVRLEANSDSGCCQGGQFGVSVASRSCSVWGANGAPPLWVGLRPSRIRQKSRSRGTGRVATR